MLCRVLRDIKDTADNDELGRTFEREGWENVVKANPFSGD